MPAAICAAMSINCGSFRFLPFPRIEIREKKKHEIHTLINSIHFFLFSNSISCLSFTIHETSSTAIAWHILTIRLNFDMCRLWERKKNKKKYIQYERHTYLANTQAVIHVSSVPLWYKSVLQLCIRRTIESIYCDVIFSLFVLRRGNLLDPLCLSFNENTIWLAHMPVLVSERNRLAPYSYPISVF